MNKELLSIIVLTYNQPVYIYTLLDSIMAQTYPSIEIIIADDASVEFDEVGISEFIRSKRGENIENFVVLRSSKNKGTVKNINNAISFAKGKYIKLIAGDDFYGNNEIFERQVDYLQANIEYLIVSGKVQDCLDEKTNVSTPGIILSNKLQDYVYSLPKNKRLRYCFYKNIFPYATQSLCFRKCFFEKFGQYDERFKLIEDLPMTVRLIDNNIMIGVIDLFVVNHRINSGMSTKKDLFLKNGLQYYTDLMCFFYDLTRKEKNVFWKLYYYDRYKIACYRIEVADNKKHKSLIALKYILFLVLYSLFHINVLSEKIRVFHNSIR